MAQAASFTRAATRLHLSQPALTVQIRRLEQTVGVRLLDRNSRNVALTPTGRELLPLLQKSLQDMEHVLSDARSLGDGASGTVRLACLPTFAASVLPELIQASEEPGAERPLFIRDVVADMVNMLVRTEEVDIGLTRRRSSDTDLEVLHAGVDRLVVVCPKEHAFARAGRTSSWKSLASRAAGTHRAGYERAGPWSTQRSQAARYTPDIACEPTYMMTAVAMVRGGLGVTILPGSAREVRAEPGLVVRPIAGRAFVRPITLIKKRGRTLPAVTEKFVAAMKKKIGATRRVP